MTDGISESFIEGIAFNKRQKKLIQFLEEYGYDWKFIRSDLFEVKIQ